MGQSDSPAAHLWFATDLPGKMIGFDAIEALRVGMPATILPALALKVGVSQDAILESLRLSRSTVKGRMARNKNLSPSESDRVFRLIRVLDRATTVIEDQDEASRWLRQKLRALGGASPIEMLDTEPGYELVMDTLGRIEAGVVS